MSWFIIIGVVTILCILIIIYRINTPPSISSFNSHNSYSVLFEFDNNCRFKKEDKILIKNKVIGIVDSIIKINNDKFYVKSLIFNKHKIPKGSIFIPFYYKTHNDIGISPSDNKLIYFPGELIESKFNYYNTDNVRL